MKRKTLCAVLVVCIGILIFGTGDTSAAEIYGDFVYELSNGEVTITEYKNTNVTEVIIPDAISGYPVTTIGGFRSCAKLEKVVIPDSVTTISHHAFARCEKLRSVNIPDSVITIGDRAFGGCYALTSVNIPDSVTSIGKDAFVVCSGVTSINIPNSVTNISPGAFSGTGLTSVNIPGSVTKIEQAVFRSCPELKSVNIPDSVVSIDFFAFQMCKKLTSVNIPKSVVSIGQRAFEECENLKEVHYAGTAEEWRKIEILNGNECLKNAIVYFNSRPITVTINGKAVAFDQLPTMENGRTLVPLRAIFEALGASVAWDGNTQTVMSQKDDIQISLQIGSSQMYVNGTVKVLDVPAKEVNGRTLVPARAVSEAFGCDVNWDGSAQTVIITY